MLKVTVLYNQPDSAEDFEKYYAETHLPLAAKMEGVHKLETTKFSPGPDASAPEYYRMAEMYFESPEQIQATLGSEAGRATVDDLKNFATGGVKILAGVLDS